MLAPTDCQLRPSALKAKVARSWPSTVIRRCTLAPEGLGTDQRSVRTPRLYFPTSMRRSSAPRWKRARNSWRSWKKQARPPPSSRVEGDAGFHVELLVDHPLLKDAGQRGGARRGRRGWVRIRRAPGFSVSDQLLPLKSGGQVKNHCKPSVGEAKSSDWARCRLATGSRGPGALAVGTLPVVGRHQPSAVQAIGCISSWRPSV